MTDHISHDRAQEALGRFIDGSFGKAPGPRRSIPARPGEDDDLVLAEYIAQQRALDAERGRPFSAEEISAVVQKTGRGILRFETPEAMLALLPTGDVVFNGRLLGNDPAILEALSTLAAGVGRSWRPKSETPPPGSVALLYFDVGDNTGAGLDEVYSVGWHDGTRWHDAHSGHDRDPAPWLHSWRVITPAAPDRSVG